MSPDTNVVTNNGRFPKGTSGNPAGRPIGSRNKSTLLMEALLEGEAEELIRKTVELAKGNDIPALALCLERIMPPRKERSVCFDLPPVRSVLDIPRAITAILENIAAGVITPAEGEKLIHILTEVVQPLNALYRDYRD